MKREYAEISVLKMELRAGMQSERTVELVHRAIPYPVVLVAWHDGIPELSLAHKRCSLAEKDKTVIDGEMVAVKIHSEFAAESLDAFRDALALNRQSYRTLRDVYQNWDRYRSGFSSFRHYW